MQGYHSCFLCVLCCPVQQSPPDGPVFHPRTAKIFRKPYNGTFSITYPVPRNRSLQWVFLYTFHFAFPVAKTHLWGKVFRTPCYDQLFITICTSLMFYLVISDFLFQLQNESFLTSLRQIAFMKTQALFITNTQHNFDRNRSNKQEVAL